MRQIFFKQEHTKATFIKLDTKKCEACWKCQNACANNVFGRINLPWHKHIRFINGSACIGCLKCLKVCNAGAITRNN